MSIRRNTIINISGSIIPMAVMLVTVPLYLKILGELRYGVLVLVWMLLGYFSFLEMGMGKATANQISRLHDAPARTRGTTFWTALLLNLSFGLVAALLLWILGRYFLASVLKIPPEFRKEAIAALPWMVGTLPLALVSSVLNGALEGRNRFLTVNILQVSSTVVFQVAPLAVAYRYGSSLAVVIPAAVLSRALMNLPFLIACYVAVPLTLPPVFSKKAAGSLLTYGGWVAVTGVISPLLETVDRFLIGAVLGVQAVTHYTLPYQLVTKARIIPGSLSRALFPTFSSASSADADRLALISLQSLTALMTPVVIGGIVLLQPFMHLWIGGELAVVVAPLGEILFFGVWANSLSYIPYALLQGKGRPDLVAKFHALEFGPFLLLIWTAIHFWGVYGAAVAWTLRIVADSALLFRFSGMPKGTMRVMGVPFLFIIAAIVAAHAMAGRGWPLRVALTLMSVTWIFIWMFKGDGCKIWRQTRLRRGTDAENELDRQTESIS